MMLSRCLGLAHTLFVAFDIKKDEASLLVLPLPSHLRLTNYLLASRSTYWSLFISSRHLNSSSCFIVTVHICSPSIKSNFRRPKVLLL